MLPFTFAVLRARRSQRVSLDRIEALQVLKMVLEDIHVESLNALSGICFRHRSIKLFLSARIPVHLHLLGFRRKSFWLGWRFETPLASNRSCSFYVVRLYVLTIVCDTTKLSRAVWHLHEVRLWGAYSESQSYFHSAPCIFVDTSSPLRSLGWTTEEVGLDSWLVCFVLICVVEAHSAFVGDWP